MSNADCPVCLESFEFPEEGVFFLVCGHCICVECSRQRRWIECPICRTPVTARRDRNENQPRPIFRRIFVRITQESAENIAPDTHDSVVTLPASDGEATRADASSEAGGSRNDGDNVPDSVDDGIGADAQKACDALEALADTPHLDSMTRAAIFDIVRTLDRDLRPSLVALRVECAHLLESRTTLAACADQLRACVQVLGDEKRQLVAEKVLLASGLQTAQVALRAAEGRAKDRTEEVLVLRDVLCASANDTNSWMRRAEALESEIQAMKRDADDRDNLVKLLTDQNHALVMKLESSGHRTWASRLSDLCLIIFFGLATLFIAFFRLALFLVEPFI